MAASPSILSNIADPAQLLPIGFVAAVLSIVPMARSTFSTNNPDRTNGATNTGGF